MNLSTKYELGQLVFGVTRTSFRRLKNCVPCSATGKVKIGDEEFVCPKCGGSTAYQQHAGEKCYIRLSSKIGMVRVQSRAERFTQDEPAMEVEYMLEDTGVNSGQIWKEEELFASKEEAERYCDQQNGLLLQDEPGAEMLPQLVGISTPTEFAIN